MGQRPLSRREQEERRKKEEEEAAANVIRQLLIERIYAKLINSL